jgi:transposase-like protein
LSDEQVNEIRTKLQNDAKVAALAREYGVSRQTIYSSTSQHQLNLDGI